MYKKGSLIMTKLKKFGGKYKDETVERIARYFGFSAVCISARTSPTRAE